MKTARTQLCLLVLLNFFSNLFAYYYDFSTVKHVTGLGYPIETHPNVRTEDGYLIDLFRIPHGKTSKNHGKKPVVLIMHGLLTMSDCWIILGENKGLPFILAEQNYDVWLGNVRGTSHGRKHVSLNPDKDPQFWDFSFHELGVYDLPAIVHHIQNVTGTKKMSYIGHSQGSTVFHVLTSKKPKYNRYFNVVIHLAPAIYVLQSSNMLSSAIPQLYNTLEALRDTMRLYEIGPQVKEAFCREKINTKEECYDMVLKLMEFGGEDVSLVDKDCLNKAAGVLFQSASFRQLMHFLQVAINVDFREYDFGIEENLVKYSSKSPPRYNLKNCKVPAAVLSARRDILVTPTDAERLIKQLPNVIFSKMYNITHSLFPVIDNKALGDNIFLQILELLNKMSRVH